MNKFEKLEKEMKEVSGIEIDRIGTDVIKVSMNSRGQGITIIGNSNVVSLNKEATYNLYKLLEKWFKDSK